MSWRRCAVQFYGALLAVQTSCAQHGGDFIGTDNHAEQPFQKQSVASTTTETNFLFGLAIIGVLLLLVFAFGVGVYVGMVIRRSSAASTATSALAASSRGSQTDLRIERSRATAAPQHSYRQQPPSAEMSPAATAPPVPNYQLQPYQHRQSSAAMATLQQFSVSSAASQPSNILSSMRVSSAAASGRRSPKDTG